MRELEARSLKDKVCSRGKVRELRGIRLPAILFAENPCHSHSVIFTDDNQHGLGVSEMLDRSPRRGLDSFRDRHSFCDRQDATSAT